jgi:transposase InsO family protein
LWRYGQIDDDALRAVLTINRYSEDEAQAFIDTALRPEQTADYINRTQRDSVFSSHLVIDPFYEAPPQPYIDAAKAEGVNAQVARDAWRSSFQFPQLNQWLSLYFRGIRTHTELMAAMDYYRVPQNLRDDYIQANRALIPFRTIPGMVAAGIIDESYAKQQLQGHGYDLQAAEALLAYSKTKVQTTTPVVAQQIHEISVATAKEFWNEGAFTDDQLKQLLVAHGYSDYTAAVTLTTMQIAHAQKLRKQVGQDIVNEALAGILTDDQAIQQFSQRNFSIQEIAKLTRQLRTGRRQNAKIPSEAELLKMAKQSIITPNDYGNALSAMGYAANWVQAIVQLNFPDGFPEPAGA